MNYKWRDVLLGSNASIEEAVRVIEKGSLRVALVVTEQGHLLGTVTDGDIRRALLKHIPLTNKVEEIMHRKPKVADVDTPRETLRAMMEHEDLLSIPLLDNGKLVGLETLQHILKRNRIENPVFLMAGGFGKRLSPLTDNCPKPLLKVGDKPILETILDGFIQSGFYRFYISTHYKSEMIRGYFGDGSKWGVEIEYVHEESPLGTGGALGLLPQDLPKLPLIMMNGDIMTKVDYAALLDYHNDNNCVATMCVREYEYQVPYGVIEIQGNRITGMVEKPVHKFFVNAGIYVISRELVQSIDSNTIIDMPTLLEKQLKQDKVVSMFPLHEYWLDVGKMNDFERAQRDYFEGFAK
ncbi:MAG: CBS domain-containing protein [Gammaproteobacteria bacterium]|nr:CBS domain-containing protein [Gammaproteobacteria bacterium]